MPSAGAAARSNDAGRHVRRQLRRVAQASPAIRRALLELPMSLSLAHALLIAHNSVNSRLSSANHAKPGLIAFQSACPSAGSCGTSQRSIHA